MRFWFFEKKLTLFLSWFTQVEVPFCVPHNCHWHFGAHKASLIALGSALFPLSNGEAQIQRLIFLFGFWTGYLLLNFALYIRPPRKSLSSFHKSSIFFRDPQLSNRLKPSRFLAPLLLKFKPLRSTRGTISINLRKFLLFLGLFLLNPLKFIFSPLKLHSFSCS